jgi:hypothetical protein
VMKILFSCLAAFNFLRWIIGFYKGIEPSDKYEPLSV